MSTALNYLIKTSSTAIVYAEITNSLFAQTGSYINFEKACYGEINKYQDITLPIGSIVYFYGTVAPNSNWLRCNASVFSAVAYPQLFAILGIAKTPNYASVLTGAIYIIKAL